MPLKGATENIMRNVTAQLNTIPEVFLTMAGPLG
jgi:hypothetical protein